MVRFDNAVWLLVAVLLLAFVVSCLPLDKMKSTYKPTAWHKGLTRADCNPAYWAAKVTNYIKARKRSIPALGHTVDSEWHEALRLEAHHKYNLRLSRKGNSE